MTRCYWWPTSARGSWDQNIVEELTGDFDHDPEGVVDEGAVVVIAGQHSLGAAEILADMTANLPWCLAIVTSDEEAAFPVELLPHDDKHQIWGQYHARPEFDRVIPIGLPPNTPDLGDEAPRDIDVMFAGQNTHARRAELIDVMKTMACEPGNGNIAWYATTGFRQGMDRDEYLDALCRTKIVPCPSGIHSLDSFRLYEAIAAGALPIIEQSTPDGREGEFWPSLFGYEYPIPTVESWEQLPDMIDGLTDPPVWRRVRDEIAVWYADYRTQLAADFENTIARLQS